MKRLSVEQIVQLHSDLIAQIGGLDGIRDANALDSAVNAPFHTFDGQYLYPTLQAKAARLCFSLIRNHPFVDGNKRAGILAMIVFLELNGLEVICTDEELVKLGTELADHSFDDKELLGWIFSHT